MTLDGVPHRMRPQGKRPSGGGPAMTGACSRRQPARGAEAPSSPPAPAEPRDRHLVLPRCFEPLIRYTRGERFLPHRRRALRARQQPAAERPGER